ncbi:MAG: DUF479 domain-containing protein [Flavobacteriaceae bacterium]|nr:DUF479 domain-containing protein [Flavobacteriaceae bacterium]
MNFLAHIYLSGDNKKVILGNFIADGIKGNKYKDYPKDIQTGILLHRAIDSYTDAHPVFKQSTKRLHSRYSHFSGVIVDIYYDHFLAKNWSNYSAVPLENYIKDFYINLENHIDILPPRVIKMMPYLIHDNWLLSYATIKGISKVLEGMNRRTNNKGKINNATIELKEYYDVFESEFRIFFDDVISFSKQKLEELS